jgi:WD40 repeat protein
MITIFFFSRTDGRVLFTDIRSSRMHYMSLDCDYTSTQSRINTSSSSSSSSVAHRGSVKSLLFLPDQMHLLTLGADQQMHLWNIHDGQRLLVNYGSIPSNGLRSLTLACAQTMHDRSKSIVYVPCGKTIRIYDILSGQRLTSLTGHLLRVTTCIYNRLCVELYSCSDDILVWSAVRQQQQQYEQSLKSDDHRTGTVRSLGQILNRDQWSDDEDDDGDVDGDDPNHRRNRT